MVIMGSLVVELLVAAVLLLMYWMRRPRRISELGEKFPGPRAYPIVGNALQLGTNTRDFFVNVTRIVQEFSGHTARVWGGNKLYLLLSEPSDLEILMGNNKSIEKAEHYDYFRPWLGNGLLTSPGAKWRRHRKILTPTFHLKILEDFVGVFLANGDILTECLQEKVGGTVFDIHHYIKLSALDNICESAMGIKINAQKNSGSDYVKAVRDIATVITERTFKLWLHNELIFSMSRLKKLQDKSLKILHGTTRKVIKSRREEITKERAVNGESSQVSEDGRKRRLAFLDLLIQSAFEGSGMTDEDIREEVDTFMFAGHDTAAAGMAYTIWMLCWHQDIQDEVYREIQQVWPDRTEPLTYQLLQEFKLLDRVIKESLRLYPIVPFYSRELDDDLVLSSGLVAPKGASLSIMVYSTHRNPKFFPDPEKFDPDRFLPENIQGRHPYAYIPFSAGPRNCIGQKFAMLEMKCTLIQVLNKYKIFPAAPTPELKLSLEVILTAMEGLPVSIEHRST